MPTAAETRLVLEEALKMEKMAEENCDRMAKQLMINGFYDAVIRIKNDEIHHQQMVAWLIETVAKNGK